MNAENVKSQMRKGTLEYCILLLLKKEPAYTSDIIQKLQEARLIVVVGDVVSAADSFEELRVS